MEENLEITGGSTTFCLKRRLKCFAQLPPSLGPNDKYPVTASHCSHFV